MWQVLLAIFGVGLVLIGIVFRLFRAERLPPNSWPLSQVRQRTIRAMRLRVEKLKAHRREDVRELAGQAGYLIGKAATKLDMDRPEEALIPANAAVATLKWAETVAELDSRSHIRPMEAAPGPVFKVRMYDATYSDVSRSLISGLAKLRNKQVAEAQTEFANVWCNVGFGLAPPPDAKLVAMMATIIIVVATSEDAKKIDPQNYDSLILAALHPLRAPYWATFPHHW